MFNAVVPLFARTWKERQETYQDTVMVQHISRTTIVTAAVLELAKLVNRLDHLRSHLLQARVQRWVLQACLTSSCFARFLVDPS